MASDSAPAELSEVEWSLYLAPSYTEAQIAAERLTGVVKMRTSGPVPVTGYRALNDLLKGEFKGHVASIQYRAVNGKWYPVLRGKK